MQVQKLSLTGDIQGEIFEFITFINWDKVSGLKSILRVVLPAGAGLLSDLNQTLYIVKSRNLSSQPCASLFLNSTWRVSLSSLNFNVARVILILDSTWRVSLSSLIFHAARVIIILKSTWRVSLSSLNPHGACHYHPKIHVARVIIILRSMGRGLFCP